MLGILVGIAVSSCGKGWTLLVVAWFATLLECRCCFIGTILQVVLAMLAKMKKNGYQGNGVKASESDKASICLALKDESALAGWDNAENSFGYGFLGSCLKKHIQAPSIVEVLYFRDFPLRPRSIRV